MLEELTLQETVHFFLSFDFYRSRRPLLSPPAP